MTGTAMEGSSPRMRGALLDFRILRVPLRIIPADAGSTIASHVRPPLRRDHPRGCGEHLPDRYPVKFCQGSSPRMRGARCPPLILLTLPRIIPADAGSTPTDGLIICGHGDHPRGCGEHH